MVELVYTSVIVYKIDFPVLVVFYLLRHRTHI